MIISDLEYCQHDFLKISIWGGIEAFYQRTNILIDDGLLAGSSEVFSRAIASGPNATTSASGFTENRILSDGSSYSSSGSSSQSSSGDNVR